MNLLSKIQEIAKTEQALGEQLSEENVSKLTQVAAIQIEVLVTKCNLAIEDIVLNPSSDKKSYYVHWSTWIKTLDTKSNTTTKKGK